MKKNTSYRSLSLSIVLATSTLALTAAQPALAKHGDKIPGEYIVLFKDYADSQIDQVALQSMKDAKVDQKQLKGKFKGLFKGFHGKLNARQLEMLKRDPRIDRIEQDTELYAAPMQKMSALGISSPIPAQPAQTVSWGASITGIGNGVGKTAWVIDSGIRPDHPDLNVDVARSKSFITGITSVLDGYGHGTMVAGIIGAKNNTIGTIGVAAGATIVALRVFDDAGRGSMSSAIKAVNHVNSVGKPGDVINMSLGGGISTTLDNAVKLAGSKGIYVAVAAGNSAIDCKNNSPARANGPGVFTVSSMGSRRNFSSFSNFGLSVDYALPGENILTTNNSGGYSSGSGTSFAAPHMAGLLLTRGLAFSKSAYVTGDKDGKPDPIASK